MKLKGKQIIITGASHGLGAELSRQLVDQGAHVFGFARSSERLKQLQESLKGKAGSFSYHECDITDLESIKHAVVWAGQQSDSFDILINDAGMWTDIELEAIDPSRRAKAFETNTVGTIQVTYAFIPLLEKSTHPLILNVISSGGTHYDAGAGWSTYSATKWALRGFSKNLRSELMEKKSRIKVMDFYPGGFESDLYESAGRKNAHDQKWMMQTADVAECAIFMLSRPDDMHVQELVVTKSFREGM